jgi:hypothetical protein
LPPSFPTSKTTFPCPRRRISGPVEIVDVSEVSRSLHQVSRLSTLARELPGVPSSRPAS